MTSGRRSTVSDDVAIRVSINNLQRYVLNQNWFFEDGSYKLNLEQDNRVWILVHPCRGFTAEAISEVWFDALGEPIRVSDAGGRGKSLVASARIARSDAKEFIAWLNSDSEADSE
jgi:hypothetical protein